MSESPCTRNCSLENDVCVSCGRTRAEIVSWGQMTDEEKASVLERLRET